MDKVCRTAKEIQDECDNAQDNPSIYLGMTYSEGVQAALNWVLGHTDSPPIEKD